MRRGAYYLLLTGTVGAAYVAAVVTLNVVLQAGALTGSAAFPIFFTLAILLLLNPLRTRLQALWTLEGLDKISATLVAGALNDSSADVRRSAVRWSEPWLRNGDATLTAAVTAHIDDPSAEVRRQVAASLGELLSQGKSNIQAPWLGLAGFFSVAIMLSLLIFIGEAVRDAFDPRKTFR